MGKAKTRAAPLTDQDWRDVFRLRCRSKSGGTLTADERALVERAYREDETRYGDMDADVFEATKPFGSNLKRYR